MEKGSKSSQVVEAELNLRVVNLMERIEKVTGSITIEANNDIVAFVGPTKSGKSTLINCLLGTELMCIRDKYQDICLMKTHGAPGPNIGGRGESETEVPVGYKNVPDDFVMWDFPGFFDNKGIEQELVNAISFQAVLLSQIVVRFVLVVPYTLINDDDPLPFYTLLCELERICPEIADSLCIVSTKGESKRVDMMLEKANSPFFSDKVEKANLDKIHRAKRIIERILENKTYVDFKAPVLENDVKENSFTLPNKQEFIDCIKKLKGSKMSDFPFVISSQGKYEIAELYTNFYDMVKKDVEITISMIEHYTPKKMDTFLEVENGKQTPAAAIHAHFICGKSTIQDIIEKSKDFKTFFVQAKEAELGINERFSETIAKFRFIEK